jgi:hypothetical protein
LQEVVPANTSSKKEKISGAFFIAIFCTGKIRRIFKKNVFLLKSVSNSTECGRHNLSLLYA